MNFALWAAGSLASSFAVYRTMFPWLKYDLEFIKIFRPVKKAYNEMSESPLLLIDFFELKVAEHPKKVFMIYEENVFTYEFVNEMANKVACIAQSWGLQAKDHVTIMIENEPEFVWTFLGLQKLGLAIALINHNLRLQSLLHCVKAVNPKYLIVGKNTDLHAATLEIIDEVTLSGCKVCFQGLNLQPPPMGVLSFDPLLMSSYPAQPSPVVRASIDREKDTCCYIYTSGTTGAPKPVPLLHLKSKFLGIMVKAIKFGSSDTIYSTLPLYHSSGCIGFFGTILEGATMVLKKKFSASQFWSDCQKHDVTVIQYIGELFRYLLAKPPSSLESGHKIRAAVGNGLRMDIWQEVKTRFNLPIIGEFFGATEGTTFTFNTSNRPGAIGRLSPLLKRLMPYKAFVVKYDPYTAQPIRDQNGHCMPVMIDEPGLYISEVPEYLKQNGKFKVYEGPEEDSEKKIVYNAFSEGDMFFNYGDLFVLDKDYFLYFKDRIGDTFRWKGENVSTLEVGNVMCALPFIQDSNVYGVTIPGHNGRAGMAALTTREGSILTKAELQELYEHVCKELPSYARPLFLRHLKEALVTATLKQKKVDLTKEGYDVSIIKDPIFFYDTSAETYSPLNPSDIDKFLRSRL